MNRTMELGLPVSRPQVLGRRQVLGLFAALATLPLIPRRARGALAALAGTADEWATGGTVSMTDEDSRTGSPTRRSPRTTSSRRSRAGNAIDTF